MIRLNRTMNSRYDENRTRSAKLPVISAGVMIANLSWNIEKTKSGIVSFSSEPEPSAAVSPPTPLNIQ